MKKEKKNYNQKKISSFAKIFIVTFLIVLGIGMSGLFMYTIISGKGAVHALAAKEELEEKEALKEKEGFHSFWEKIPEEEITEIAKTKYENILSNPEFMQENRIYEKKTMKEDVVTLGFAGDILFDDEYAMMANLLQRGVSIDNGISKETLAQMKSVDIMMVNNEFAFTDRGTRTEGKTYTFRADTKTVSYLEDMGVDVVSLGNNHVYDYGEVGLLDTLDTLETAQIPYVGAGKNLKEASAPIYFIAGDIKIAIVAATQIERLDSPDTKGATETGAGVFRCWNPELLYEKVAEAKAKSDFVIVYIHWGTENVAEPDWAQLKQAPEIAAAGADLIIGDHPHCLQGIQFFGETPVIYSLGNFWFNSKTVDTGMVEVSISQKGLESFRFVPALQSDCRTNLAYGTDKERILSYMRTLSPGVQIDEEGYVSLE